MENFDSLDYSYEDNSNSRLYEFLATNYNISNLADKINASNRAHIGLLNLKKILTMIN